MINDDEETRFIRLFEGLAVAIPMGLCLIWVLYQLPWGKWFSGILL